MRSDPTHRLRGAKRDGPHVATKVRGQGADHDCGGGDPGSGQLPVHLCLDGGLCSVSGERRCNARESGHGDGIQGTPGNGDASGCLVGQRYPG
jgi:hypothetical protein